LIKLEKIHFERQSEIDSRDVFWLHRAADKRCTAVELVERALKGQNDIYRITGDAEGVLVVAAEGNKLSVEGFAGKGIVKHFKEFYKQARLLAAVKGLDTLTGYVQRPGIEELYRKHTGAKQVMALWEEKLR
jgi:hypothetical protein